MILLVNRFPLPNGTFVDSISTVEQLLVRYMSALRRREQDARSGMTSSQLPSDFPVTQSKFLARIDNSPGFSFFASIKYRVYNREQCSGWTLYVQWKERNAERPTAVASFRVPNTIVGDIYRSVQITTDLVLEALIASLYNVAPVALVVTIGPVYHEPGNSGWLARYVESVVLQVDANSDPNGAQAVRTVEQRVMCPCLGAMQGCRAWVPTSARPALCKDHLGMRFV
ncbi:unnamed protein product [Mycena citricolor]|uniref:Uncharacterized protein n=1 Tax=Mycena citricolor TaxID=2018698 RepID=A0AAD2HI99_9AGAR|nr:unnamed protein product [Mycena citricolor]